MLNYLGATSLRVVFDRMCSTERQRDILTLHDAACTKTYASLSGMWYMV